MRRLLAAGFVPGFLAPGLLVAGLILLPRFVAAGPAADPAAPTSAEVTDRGRALPYIVDQLLRGVPEPGPRTVVLLVDPSASLATARFADEIEQGLARLGEGGPALALAVVGDQVLLRVPPTQDRARLLAGLREALAAPRDQVRDVMAAVRAIALGIRGREGRREIALVTLENGDGESDLEETAALLEKSRVTLHVVGRSSFLADTYWVRLTASAPRGLDMRGQDAAYDDLPWGWLFQWSVANEAVPSGFGMFGLSRIVERSGGRYFLYYPPSSVMSSCAPSGCRLCAADHAACGTVYATHRLRPIAPPLVSRLETRRALARDPLFQKLLDVWDAASDAGLLSSRPPLRPGPGLLREERRRTATAAAWTGVSNYGGMARKAAKLVPECARLAKDLEDALATTAAESTTERSIAVVETTRAYLLVTGLNLRLLQAFCERVPVWLAPPGAGPLPPEVPLLDPARFDYRGVTFTNQCFCHGAAAIERLEIPGLAEASPEKEEAFAAVDRLVAKYDGTPFGRAARIMGVAIFHLSVPARPGEYHRPIPTDETDGTASGGTTRAPRGGDTGGSGGTSTGGK